MKAAGGAVVLTAVGALEVSMTLADTGLGVANPVAIARRSRLRRTRAESLLAGLTVPLAFANAA